MVGKTQTKVFTGWNPEGGSGILPLARGWKPLPHFQTLEKSGSKVPRFGKNDRKVSNVWKTRSEIAFHLCVFVPFVVKIFIKPGS